MQAGSLYNIYHVSSVRTLPVTQLLLASLGIQAEHLFCLMGPEARLACGVYAWVVFHTPCFPMACGASGLFFCILLQEKVCIFSYFYLILTMSH